MHLQNFDTAGTIVKTTPADTTNTNILAADIAVFGKGPSVVNFFAVGTRVVLEYSVAVNISVAYSKVFEVKVEISAAQWQQCRCDGS